ncbi:MAG: hypothetical protein ACYCWW_14015 [Deltaproteobacteria bacterium]
MPKFLAAPASLGLLAGVWLSLLGCGSPGTGADGGGPLRCIPGRSLTCACAGGGSGVQVCGRNGTFAACDCGAGTSGGDGGGLPPECVPGYSTACSCPNGQGGAQVCQPDGSFAACDCPGPAADDGGLDAGVDGGTDAGLDGGQLDGGLDGGLDAG